MKFAYSNAEMRVADSAAIAAGTPEETLMERAGAALADAVERAAQKLGAGDMLFVCGGGNNGGDGFVAARILRERGYDADVLCMAERFSAGCKRAMEAFGEAPLGRMPRRRYAVVVDCLFGTGLDRAPTGDAAALIGFINGSGAYVVACDIPSGLGEGVAYPACVRADETVTMGQLKQALLLSDGADAAGKITVAEIGIPASGGAEIWEEQDVAPFFPRKKSHTNKGDYGTVAVLSTCNTLGAPLLAVGAALRSGAGYTDLYMTSASVPCEDAAKLASFQTADELHRVLCAAKYPACRFTFYDGEPVFAGAVAFGMGAGVGETTCAILEELFSSEQGGVLVLDADALNTLAAFGAELLKRSKRPVVVTPHIKEFSRLTAKTVGEILSDPVGCAQAFAREYGVTVVLKNNRTVITDGARTAINCTGSPVLAKGGSGDALAGFLAGTCARGVPPYEAAVVSSYVFGRAGELAARDMGEYAPTAEDVIARLPEAMKFSKE